MKLDRSKGVRSVEEFFRGDAGFAAPEIYQLLEHEGYEYTIRLRGNPNLERKIEHLLYRPMGRDNAMSEARYHAFEFQVASWDRPRQVVAEVTWFASRLFPAVGFIVTKLTWAPRRVTHFYDQRGKPPRTRGRGCRGGRAIATESSGTATGN